jgi:hypothetical protein
LGETPQVFSAHVLTKQDLAQAEPQGREQFMIGDERVLHSSALPFVKDNAGAAQVSQMAREQGLRQAKNCLHLANAQGALEQQVDDPEAGGIGEGFEEVGELPHWLPTYAYSHISLAMSSPPLCQYLAHPMSLVFPSAYDPLSQLKKTGTVAAFAGVGLYFSLISTEVFGSSARAAPLALC